MEDRIIYSIVMAYYNRRQLLLNTLRTISFSSKVHQLEVIITDDASDESERIDDIPSMFNYPIRVIRVEPQEKWYVNPCIPYNMAIKKARGSTIIIQNPEVLHAADVLSYIEQNLTDQNYVICGVYAINQKLTEKISALNYSSSEIWYDIIQTLSPLNKRDAFGAEFTGWYNHSVYRPAKYHFLSAITKKNMDKLRGFDERYAYGIDRDDLEFVHRIERNGLKPVFLDDAIGIHQHHAKVAYQRSDVTELQKRNRDLFENTTSRETRWAVFNTDNVKVSVIIPFYNRIEWLIEAVESVFNQTHPNIEVILINDGSTEDISPVVELNKEKKIKLLQQEHGGAGKARNMGIQNATGDYIAFLDADDLFLPYKIQNQLLFMMMENHDASHTSYLIFDEQNTFTIDSGKQNILFPSILHTCESALPTLMVRRNFLLENNIRFPEYFVSQDVCFMIQITEVSPIMGINNAYVRVRKHGNFCSYDNRKSLTGLCNILQFTCSREKTNTEYDAILPLLDKIRFTIDLIKNKPLNPPVENQLSTQQKVKDLQKKIAELKNEKEKWFKILSEPILTPEYDELILNIESIEKERIDIDNQLQAENSKLKDYQQRLADILFKPIPSVQYDALFEKAATIEKEKINLEKQYRNLVNELVQKVKQLEDTKNKLEKKLTEKGVSATTPVTYQPKRIPQSPPPINKPSVVRFKRKAL